MKLYNLKVVFILTLLGLSSISLTSCSKTYSKTPNHMKGYYLSHYTKSNSSLPILMHFDKHNISSAFIPYNREKLARKAVRKQEVQLYEQGLQNAETSQNKNSQKKILHDRNMLKRLNTDFTIKDSAHNKALEHNLENPKILHISNVKYLHHIYYIKGHLSSKHYIVFEKHLHTIKHRNKGYDIDKFRYNHKHQLELITRMPERNILTPLHRISRHTATMYLAHHQIK